MRPGLPFCLPNRSLAQGLRASSRASASALSTAAGFIGSSVIRRSWPVDSLQPPPQLVFDPQQVTRSD